MWTHLRSIWIKLVAGGLAVDRIAGTLVDNLEDTGFGDIEISISRLVHDALLDGESSPVGVLLAHGNRMRLLNDKRILLSVDRRINTEREDVLMVRSEDLVVDNGSPRQDLVVHRLVDGLRGEDTGRADFDMDVGSLSESPCLNQYSITGSYKDVFVVGDSNDSLDNQDTCTGDGSDVGAIVGVFPTDTAIFFVQTNRILHLQWLTLRVGAPSVKVLELA